MAADPLIYVVDPIHPVGMERLANAFATISPVRDHDDPRMRHVTHIVVRTSALTETFLATLPNLKAIVKHGAGVDNIPIPFATSRGVMVANTPGGNNSTAVAEGAVSMMLGLLRQLKEMDAVVRQDRWGERWTTRLGDLTGSRVGLIGFGRIARCTAKICGAGFDAEVAAYDPVVPPDGLAQTGVRPMGLDELLAWADVVSIHVPLMDGTRNMIGASQFALMKRTAIIVNCSRGGIIHEPALVDALASGAIAGAGIDVFETEPPPADHPLFALPNSLLTPHVAGVTEVGMKGMAMACADAIEAIIAGQRPANLLNPEVL